MSTAALARIVGVFVRLDFDLQLYYWFFKTELCYALVFTVVDFHLEPTLPQILQTAFGGRLCFTGQSPLRFSKTHYKV